MDTEINFETGTAAPLIILPVTINDSLHEKFILDIGSGTTLVTAAFAGNHNIIATHYKEGAGAGGTVKVGLGTVKSIQVGKLRYEDFEIGITDDVKRIAAAIGNPEVAGNLGYSFLKDHVLCINYPEKKLRITAPENLTNPAGNKNIFMLADAARPVVIVNAYINGKGPFAFILDTGASVTNVSNELASSLVLTVSSGPEITAAAGKVKTSVAMLTEIRIGNDRQNNLPVLIGNYFEMLSKAIGKKIDGVLGYDFMKQYKITIDYPASYLYLKNNAGLNTSYIK